MTTPVPIPQVMQLFTGSNPPDFETRDTDPGDGFLTAAEAEEEAMAQLWAADRGNQGA